MGLTKKEKLTINTFESLEKVNGYPPSVRELGEALGLNSSSTVCERLKNLKRKGYNLSTRGKGKNGNLLPEVWVFARKLDERLRTTESQWKRTELLRKLGEIL